ncbi:MAG: hypothetical protein ACXWT4_01915 [Methylobacter sp.]
MNAQLLACSREIDSGNASRFIKKKWLNGQIVSPSAFDLRDKTPPETYVSFYLVEGNDHISRLDKACETIQTRTPFKNQPGAVIVLKIKTCLEEINDEAEKIITFKDETVPHCGLHYLTSDIQKVVEAKTVLCLLATECIRRLEKRKE